MVSGSVPKTLYELFHNASFYDVFLNIFPLKYIKKCCILEKKASLEVSAWTTRFSRKPPGMGYYPLHENLLLRAGPHYRRAEKEQPLAQPKNVSQPPEEENTQRIISDANRNNKIIYFV